MEGMERGAESSQGRLQHLPLWVSEHQGIWAAPHRKPTIDWQAARMDFLQPVKCLCSELVPATQSPLVSIVNNTEMYGGMHIWEHRQKPLCAGNVSMYLPVGVGQELVQLFSRV